MLNRSTTDEGSHSAPDYQKMRVRGLLSEPGVSDFTDGQGMFFILKRPIPVATSLTSLS